MGIVQTWTTTYYLLLTTYYLLLTTYCLLLTTYYLQVMSRQPWESSKLGPRSQPRIVRAWAGCPIVQSCRLHSLAILRSASGCGRFSPNQSANRLTTRDPHGRSRFPLGGCRPLKLPRATVREEGTRTPHGTQLPSYRTVTVGPRPASMQVSPLSMHTKFKCTHSTLKRMARTKKRSWRRCSGLGMSSSCSSVAMEYQPGVRWTIG